ncbi:unannotated protein [freshwater metagenome]|uniref:Unannotated protein n=1 Tax=freshwater metagenome TaxID=449393 RepID=A0A6J6MV89_9ZZZZ
MRTNLIARAACALAIAFIGVGAIGAGRALAHASLEASIPAASSVLETAPPLVVLNFDEDIEVPLSSIQLFDQTGKIVPLGSPTAGGDTTIVQSTVPTIGNGLYAVVWRVTSSDGHVIDGAFSFQVGTAIAGDSAKLLDTVLHGSHAAPVVGRTSGVARFGAFFGASILLGGLFMVMMAGGEAVHGWAARRLLWLGWGLLAVGSLANFGLLGATSKAGSLGDMLDTSLWGDVAGTRTGGLLVARFVLIALFVPVVMFVNRKQAAWWPIAAPFLGLLTIFTFSAAGHSSVAEQAALWIGVDAVHLAFVVLWLGSLVMLAVGGGAWTRDTQFAGAVKGFSRVATIGIPLIIATGFAQTWRLGASLSTLTDTTWGRLLLAKVAIAVLMVTIGAASRWLLSHEGPGALRRLVFTEAVCGIAVLGLAAGLVTQPPTVAPAAKVFTASLTEGGLIAEVSLAPGRVGVNDVHLVVTPSGGSLVPVVSIKATMSLPAQQIFDTEVTLAAEGTNHYSGKVTLPFAGDWVLTITIEPSAGQSVVLSSAVVIP